MNKKGFIAPGLAASALAVVITIASVLIFFFVFKFHVDLQMKETYNWNKIQEIPLSLLSMDVDDQSFVSKMNKIYYLTDEGDIERDQFKDIIDGNISKQLFYYLGSVQHPFEVEINIAGIEISEYLEGCMIVEGECTDKIPPGSGRECHCFCSGGCGSSSNEQLTISKVDENTCNRDYSIDDCIYVIGETVKYSAKYPFPLVFSGTDKLVDELSYRAEEVK